MTRLPRPGRAKTRLFPALGPDGAARLQRNLTERLTVQARRARLDAEFSIIVSYTGGNQQEARRWLGDDLTYHQQGEGDLGQRMAGALNYALDEGHGPVVLVGSDIPDLDAAVIKQAFTLLADHDLVLGPGEDGGYYLIGLNKLAPRLFEGMAWSTPSVLEQTLAVAKRLGLSTRLTTTLSDIDEPDDLALWRRIQRHEAGRVSVIIPALNEEKNIARAVASARNGGAFEVIVVNGHSSDRTAERARRAGALVISAPRGRSMQMNAGAALAVGQHLLFLHADTILSSGWAEEVARILADPCTAAGAFRFQVDQRGAGLRFIELTVTARCALAKLPYGDQALFMPRELFNRVGGYPLQPIMEDVELVQRLKAHGKIRISRLPAITSARRWRAAGVFRTTALNYFMMIARFMGGDLTTLRGIYDRLDTPGRRQGVR